MKNIIITGAGGFLGSSLVRRLIEENIHIWVIDKNLKDGVLKDEKNITRVTDKLEINEFNHLLKGTKIDAFYNLAWRGVNGPDKAQYDVQISNVMLTLHYAELAKALGCKKFLCTGTIAERAVDSLHLLSNITGSMMYGAAKLCSHIMLETYCKSIGLDFVWMQLANIFGPENKTGNLISYTVDKLKRGEEAYFGPAQQPYDFLYIDDLIEAMYRLGTTKTDKNFYYVGSGRPRKLEAYLKAVGTICGRADLIHIGERADDGIKYSYDMMDSSDTMKTIGDYVSDTFENHVRFTFSQY